MTAQSAENHCDQRPSQTIFSEPSSEKISMTLLERLFAGNGQSHKWIRDHLDYPHKDWCLIWPFGCNQGGYAIFGDPTMIVSRVMCEYKHGPSPADKPQAAHECGRGQLACVNPNHVTWKSHSENMFDRGKHEGPRPRFKLTPEQVDEIRALKDRARVKDIAEQFGITDVTVRQIHSGKLWRDTNRTISRVFSEDEIRSIRARKGTGPLREMAAEYGVSTSVIHRILVGRSYRWVLDNPTRDTGAA